MRVTIRFFARLRDIAGTADVIREVPQGGTVETAWLALAAEFPDMARYRGSVSVAVNAEYGRFSQALADGDELVFLPPVSGG